MSELLSDSWGGIAGGSVANALFLSLHSSDLICDYGGIEEGKGFPCLCSLYICDDFLIHSINILNARNNYHILQQHWARLTNSLVGGWLFCNILGSNYRSQLLWQIDWFKCSCMPLNENDYADYEIVQCHHAVHHALANKQATAFPHHPNPPTLNL